MADRFNFRIWDRENKCFSTNILSTIEGVLKEVDFETGTITAVDQINYEIMQSTGLVDKNGKEIFEGDFLKDDETGDILNVQWREDGACFGVSINENWQDYDWRDFGELDMYDLESLEIIGNEYENPDCWRNRK